MSDVSQLEGMRRSAVVQVERRDAALRLAHNLDFKKLILEGFCKDEAVRYIQEAGDPMLNAEQRADAMNMALAGGHLRRFLVLTGQLGDMAADKIEQIDEVLEQARSEEDQARANPSPDED